MSKSSEAVKLWRRNTKLRMITAMGGKCAICEYNKSSNALDFHHLDPTFKEMSFGKMRSHPAGWGRIVIELRKCVLLCCRCHREVHEGLAEVPPDHPRFDETFADYQGLKDTARSEPCPICQTPKPLHLVTCSKTCAGKHRAKGDWNSIDVILLVESGSSYESIGRQLGVTGAAVKKRYLKLKREL